MNKKRLWAQNLVRNEFAMSNLFLVQTCGVVMFVADLFRKPSG